MHLNLITSSYLLDVDKSICNLKTYTRELSWSQPTILVTVKLPEVNSRTAGLVVAFVTISKCIQDSPSFCLRGSIRRNSLAEWLKSGGSNWLTQPCFSSTECACKMILFYHTQKHIEVTNFEPPEGISLLVVVWKPKKRQDMKHLLNRASSS